MKLPARVWSQVGPVNVRHEAGMIDNVNKEDAAYGKWNAVQREITIDPSACDATQLITLGHEITHVALWDAGGENVLSEAQTEFVCDAMGSYLAGAIQAGFIVLKAK